MSNLNIGSEIKDKEFVDSFVKMSLQELLEGIDEKISSSILSNVI